MTRWMTRVGLVLFLLVSMSMLVACHERAATRAECQLILDRIITIELGELGYRDPIFARRKQTELRTRLKSRLDACIGRPIPTHAITCIPNATTTEHLSHDCLR